MANPHRGEVTIKLARPGDGEEPEELILRPTFEAICEIEDHAGMGIMPLIVQLKNYNLTARNLFAVLQAGLTAAGTKIEHSELGERVFVTGIHTFYSPVAQFLSHCWVGPSADDPLASEATAASPSTSPTAGSPPANGSGSRVN